jgi:hypothetical protein
MYPQVQTPLKRSASEGADLSRPTLKPHSQNALNMSCWFTREGDHYGAAAIQDGENPGGTMKERQRRARNGKAPRLRCASANFGDGQASPPHPFR